ncbi:MAG TPA: LysR family transcriptional regulator [Polyangiales bacterium]|nr:LysR family transcriptional regulator [Polyangiales bacterium]
MPPVNLSTIDLNLLVVLEAIVQEQSATRAAARLHVTQSAISSALRRLRELFDDPLMVRTRHGFVPTERALQLAPELERVLSGARALLAPSERDPTRSARTFSVAATDAVSVVIIPTLLPALRRSMPLARLHMVTLERVVAGQGLARGEVDLLIGIPPSLPAGCSGELLYEDEIVCVTRSDHPSLQRGKRLTLDVFARLPHAEVALFGTADDRVDRALARASRTREIAITVPHFSSIPYAVAHSDCVAVLGRRLANVYAKALGLRIHTPPIPLPGLTVQQVWHQRSAHDPGLARLRELLRTSVTRR